VGINGWRQADSRRNSAPDFAFLLIIWKLRITIPVRVCTNSA
jgi:hypothetical protein